MKASYSRIKDDTKLAMQGHIGEVILVALILPMAFSMIASFFNGFFGYIHWSLPTILSVFTNAIATYITIRMVIKISRYKSDKIFNDFLGTKKGILNVMGYSLFSILLLTGYVIIFWDYFVMAWDLIKIMPDDYFASDPDALDAWWTSYNISEPTSSALISAGIYSLFIMYITLRFSFTTYIIADSDYKFLSAMGKSWNLTKGNWWRIFFFPLSFILWLLLGVVTLGIGMIYVGPYMTIAQGSFYNHLLKENGESVDFNVLKTTVENDIADEEALDENKDTFDKEDPFENYYE